MFNAPNPLSTVSKRDDQKAKKMSLSMGSNSGKVTPASEILSKPRALQGQTPEDRLRGSGYTTRHSVDPNTDTSSQDQQVYADKISPLLPATAPNLIPGSSVVKRLVTDLFNSKNGVARVAAKTDPQKVMFAEMKNKLANDAQFVTALGSVRKTLENEPRYGPNEDQPYVPEIYKDTLTSLVSQAMRNNPALIKTVEDYKRAGLQVVWRYDYGFDPTAGADGAQHQKDAETATTSSSSASTTTTSQTKAPDTTSTSSTTSAGHSGPGAGAPPDTTSSSSTTTTKTPETSSSTAPNTTSTKPPDTLEGETNADPRTKGWSDWLWSKTTSKKPDTQQQESTVPRKPIPTTLADMIIDATQRIPRNLFASWMEELLQENPTLPKLDVTSGAIYSPKQEELARRLNLLLYVHQKNAFENTTDAYGDDMTYARDVVRRALAAFTSFNMSFGGGIEDQPFQVVYTVDADQRNFFFAIVELALKGFLNFNPYMQYGAFQRTMAAYYIIATSHPPLSKLSSSDYWIVKSNMTAIQKLGASQSLETDYQFDSKLQAFESFFSTNPEQARPSDGTGSYNFYPNKVNPQTGSKTGEPPGPTLPDGVPQPSNTIPFSKTGFNPIPSVQATNNQQLGVSGAVGPTYQASGVPSIAPSTIPGQQPGIGQPTLPSLMGYGQALTGIVSIEPPIPGTVTLEQQVKNAEKLSDVEPVRNGAVQGPYSAELLTSDEGQKDKVEMGNKTDEGKDDRSQLEIKQEIKADDYESLTSELKVDDELTRLGHAKNDGLPLEISSLDSYFSKVAGSVGSDLRGSEMAVARTFKYRLAESEEVESVKENNIDKSIKSMLRTHEELEGDTEDWRMRMGPPGSRFGREYIL